jgi:putative ABC transport system permease protein
VNNQDVWDFEIEGRPRPKPGDVAWNAGPIVVSPGYFETLSIPILRGRAFTAQDDARAMSVGIVNQAMAERFFNGEDPIGRRIRVFGLTNPEAWMTIVGIAGNVRDEALESAPRPVYYLLHGQLSRTLQGSFRSMSIVARVDGSPDKAAAAVRHAVNGLDARLPVFDVQTLDAVVDKSVARPRFTTLLLTLFAAIGMVLGATGIYGVLAYTVARRTQEIGIRRALGAPTGRLVREVVSSGMQPVGAGLAIGIVGSLWTSRLLTTQLFGVSPTDLRTYAAAVAAGRALSLTATLIPARRALRVDPIAALRAD